MSSASPSESGISVLILTLNEEVSLAQCLESVAWSTDIVILDSFSSDNTKDICEQFENVRFYQRQFDNYSSQRNYALHHIEYSCEWLFIIDADEICPRSLAFEMVSAVQSADCNTVVFMMRRKDFFMGRWMQHNSMYPVWLERLVRPRQVRYQRAIHEYLVFSQKWAVLDGHLYHFPFNKGLDFWLERYNRYSTIEAEERLKAREPIELGMLFACNPLVRRKTLKSLSFYLPARFLIFFLHNVFIKWCFLDGKRGMYYVMLKTWYEFLIDVKLFFGCHYQSSFVPTITYKLKDSALYPNKYTYNSRRQ